MSTTSEYVEQLHRRASQFAEVFAPDAIDAAMAACDEALLVIDTPSGVKPERARLFLKEDALRKVAEQFSAKADELEGKRWRLR